MLSALAVTLKTLRQTFKIVVVNVVGVVNVDIDFDERGPEGDCVDSVFNHSMTKCDVILPNILLEMTLHKDIIKRKNLKEYYKSDCHCNFTSFQ